MKGQQLAERNTISHGRVSRRNNAIVDTISFLVAFLFTYTAASKLMDFETFKTQLSQSPFITRYAELIAWGLPPFELVLSVLLIINRTRLVALFGSLFLMALFTSYIAMMLNYSFYIPCSCGGVIGQMNWGQHLWFNIGFILLILLAIMLYVKNDVPQKKTLELTDQANVLTNLNEQATI